MPDVLFSADGLRRYELFAQGDPPPQRPRPDDHGWRDDLRGARRGLLRGPDVHNDEPRRLCVPWQRLVDSRPVDSPGGNASTSRTLHSPSPSPSFSPAGMPGSDAVMCSYIMEKYCGTTLLKGYTTSTMHMFLSDCGGHAGYHNHVTLACEYTSSPTSTSTAHSELTAILLDGRGLYGMYESGTTKPTNLDACNGHTGPVPAATGTLRQWVTSSSTSTTTSYSYAAATSVYHYHVTSTAPVRHLRPAARASLPCTPLTLICASDRSPHCSVFQQLLRRRRCHARDSERALHDMRHGVGYVHMLAGLGRHVDDGLVRGKRLLLLLQVRVL